MSIEFPLVNVNTKFGKIPTPLLNISILTTSGYQSYQFLFDTGADFTMLPRYMAEDTGLDIKQLPQIRSMGIEGKGINVYVGRIQIKIGAKRLLIKCLFSEKDTTPFLIGRIDIFDHFDITFNNRHKKVIFTSIK